MPPTSALPSPWGTVTDAGSEADTDTDIEAEAEADTDTEAEADTEANGVRTGPRSGGRHRGRGRWPRSGSEKRTDPAVRDEAQGDRASGCPRVDKAASASRHNRA